jgi:hypothetical protein
MVDRMAETCASGDSPPSKRLSHHVSLTIFGQEASQLAADVRLRVHALVAGCFDIDVVVAVPVPIFPPGLPTRGAKQGRDRGHGIRLKSPACERQSCFVQAHGRR